MNRDDLEVGLSMFAILALGVGMWIVMFILGTGILVWLDKG